MHDKREAHFTIKRNAVLKVSNRQGDLVEIHKNLFLTNSIDALQINASFILHSEMTR